MSTKENAAVSQLLALLEARYALRVLWALRDGHAQTFRLLQDSVGGITPNTLNTRIKELREAGIVGHRTCSSGCPTCRPLPASGSWGRSRRRRRRLPRPPRHLHRHPLLAPQCPQRRPRPRRPFPHPRGPTTTPATADRRQAGGIRPR